ncbi:MAG TPA: ATP-binding protein [Sphingobacteriaceae bacterium]
MKLSTRIFLGFSIVIVLSLTDSYINFLLTEKVNRNSAFLTNSENIIRNSSRLHKGIIEMQSVFRGFLLTENESFLTTYYNGMNTLPRLFEEERRLLTESPEQLEKLDSIQYLHRQWIDYANAVIAAKREALNAPGKGHLYQDIFENKLKKQLGKNINDEVTQKFREFDRFEYRVREARRSVLQTSIERTKTFSIIFVVLTVIIGLISTFYIVNFISKRITGMVDVAKNISNGQFTKVKDDQNDELTSLSVSLNSMSETLSKNIRELEKRNSELDQFGYVVSHDLKAPIRGIHNVIQWIEEDLHEELSGQMKKYFGIIRERIRRMEELITGLLDYARINREKPLKEPVDVNLLVKDLADLIVPKEFDLRIETMPVLTTERIRLQQVFSNLMSNSVKYTQASVPRIDITCREMKKVYEFSVADNGIGIAPEFHDKIFEVFQTLRDKNAKESTGIGLAIVKKIIDDQHCNISVSSDAGKGAAFVFTWPKN